jgi:hypothetical protein
VPVDRVVSISRGGQWIGVCPPTHPLVAW